METAKLRIFGMRLVAYDPFVSADRARQLGVELIPTVEELFAVADFVSVHLPKTPETMGLIDAALLARAKPGLRIINTATGEEENSFVDRTRPVDNSRSQGSSPVVFFQQGDRVIVAPDSLHIATWSGSSRVRIWMPPNAEPIRLNHRCPTSDTGRWPQQINKSASRLFHAMTEMAQKAEILPWSGHETRFRFDPRKRRA